MAGVTKRTIMDPIAFGSRMTDPGTSTVAGVTKARMNVTGSFTAFRMTRMKGSKKNLKQINL